MLVSKESIKPLIDEYRKSGRKIVFTNGCFDIIHAGHVKYLEEARRLGDILVLGLNSDESVKILKGPSRPVNGEKDRAAVLSGLRSIDFVLIFDEETPFNLINYLKPDILVKGGDYDPDDIVGADIVRDGGGKVVVIEFVEGKSTSSIIEKINKS